MAEFFVLVTACLMAVEVIGKAIWLQGEIPPRTRGSVAFDLVCNVALLVLAVIVFMRM